MAEKVNTEEFKDVTGGSSFGDASQKVLSQDKILPVKDGYTTHHTCVKCGREFEVAHWANGKVDSQQTLFCKECRKKNF